MNVIDVDVLACLGYILPELVERSQVEEDNWAATCVCNTKPRWTKMGRKFTNDARTKACFD
jgi:hypothetical protein